MSTKRDWELGLDEKQFLSDIVDKILSGVSVGSKDMQRAYVDAQAEDDASMKFSDYRNMKDAIDAGSKDYEADAESWAASVTENLWKQEDVTESAGVSETAETTALLSESNEAEQNKRKTKSKSDIARENVANGKTDVEVDASSFGANPIYDAQEQKLAAMIADPKTSETVKKALSAGLLSDNFMESNEVKSNKDYAAELFEKAQTSKNGQISAEEAKECAKTLKSAVEDDNKGVDISEMTIGAKTDVLGNPNAKYSDATVDGKNWAESDAYKDGKAIAVAGGIVRQEDGKAHYSGYLGDFSFDPKKFQLGYVEAETTAITADGGTKKNMISVPVLHYSGKEELGGDIDIPQGVQKLDYTFAGKKDLKTMPEIPDGVESIHCAFENCPALETAASKYKEGENGVTMDGSMGGGKFLGFIGTGAAGAGKSDWYGRAKGDGGTWHDMPASMKDVSGAFRNDTNLKDHWNKMGSNVYDARGMFQGCETIGQWTEASGETVDDHQKMIDTSQANHLYGEFAKDMYDAASNGPMASIMGDWSKSFLNKPESSLLGEDGDVKAQVLAGADVNSEESQMFKKMADRMRLTNMTDSEHEGTTYLQAKTGGQAANTFDQAGHNVDNVLNDLANHSTGATGKGADLEILDRGIAAVGTYGVVAGLTKNKVIGLIAAAVPQFIGKGCKISSLLDGLNKLVGKDKNGKENQFGAVLTKLSAKLKAGSEAGVEAKDITELFDKAQTETTKYVAADFAMGTQKYNGNDFSLFTKNNISTSVHEDGKAFAAKGNMITAAYTDEDSYKKLVGTSIETGTQQIEDALANVEGAPTLENKSQAKELYKSMLLNVDSMCEGADYEVYHDTQYYDTAELQNRGHRGVEKVRRSAFEPVYESICKEAALGNIELTDEDIKELDAYADDMSGVCKFSDYKKVYDNEFKETQDYSLLDKVMGVKSVAEDEDVKYYESQTAQMETLKEKTADSDKTVAAQAKKDYGKMAEETFGSLIQLADESGIDYSTDGTGQSTSKRDPSSELPASAVGESDKSSSKDTEAEAD